MSELETKASQIAGLVPQVFYDLIGRIVPGAFLLALGFRWAFAEDWQCKLSSLLAEGNIRYSLFLMLGLLFSYIVAVLLGGVGYFADRVLSKIITEVQTGRNSSDNGESGGQVKQPKIWLSQDQRHYVYDAIHHYDPAAGARLAKLSAEKNMCRILIVGIYSLMVAHIARYVWYLDKWWLFFRWWLFFVCCILCAALFYWHLWRRSSQLLEDVYCLLQKDLEPGLTVKARVGRHKKSTRRSGQDARSRQAENKRS